jgi:cell division protein FtsB
MQFLKALAILLALTVAVTAQQLPSQVAIQIDSVINQWAQALEAQQKQIEELKKENADLKAKLEAEKK